MAVTDETKARWGEKVAVIVEATDKGLLHLNEWEQGFMGSVEYRLMTGEELSFQQSCSLNKIYGRLE